MFKDKNILLIGGTGTIGQGLIRKIIKYSPNQIRIFSRDEYKQFELQNEISEHEKLQFLIGDVRDFSQLVNAMDNIDYVFHLAALKHVSSCEYNPFEAIQTNIIGTNNVIRAAVSQKIKKVIFTSSDKAIYM